MIFIGYDKNYETQYYNCLKTIKGDVSPTPTIDRQGSTAFTFSRFLVPSITHYKGWHIFADSDFLFLDDINKLYDIVDDQYAVMVVKHPKYNAESIKMDGKKNSYYDRKNWASLILWNSGHKSNKILSRDVIEYADPLDLLQFRWLDDSEIGEIDPKWNVLVDHQDTMGAKGLHFTNGVNTDYYEKLLSEVGN
jgi:lipopolysaccharide biosynthesis glycosyltransferase